MKIPLCRSLIHGALFATTFSLWSGEAAAQPKIPVAHPAVGAYSQAVALPAPNAGAGTGRDSPAEIEPSDSEAWQARDVREMRAAAVMTPQVAAAQQAQELAVFNECVKRMAGVEKSDPARALAEYRKFLVGKTPSAVVGVQAAIKVSQMRESLHDIKGSFLVCDVMGEKYFSEPSSILLALQKLDVMSDQKDFIAEARYASEMMPTFLAVEPDYYSRISETLLRVQQAQSESGTKVALDSSLCVGIEQLYLKWLKKETVSHTWQRFEDLEARFRKCGDEKNANELLPKVIDALLQSKPAQKNPELADISVMAARWLSGRGQSQLAQRLYTNALTYGNEFVSQVDLTDQGSALLEENNPTEAVHLIETLSIGDKEVGPLWIKAQAYWQMEDWGKAREILEKIKSLNQINPGNGADVLTGAALERLKILNEWKDTPFALPIKNVATDADSSGQYHFKIYIHSLKKKNFRLQFTDGDVKVISLTSSTGERSQSGLLVDICDVTISASSKTSSLSGKVVEDGNSEFSQNFVASIKNEDE